MSDETQGEDMSEERTRRGPSLPRIYSNPLMILDIVNDLEEMADETEKRFDRDAKLARKMRPKVLRIRAFAKELEKNANRKLEKVDAGATD